MTLGIDEYSCNVTRSISGNLHIYIQPMICYEMKLYWRLSLEDYYLKEINLRERLYIYYTIDIWKYKNERSRLHYGEGGRLHINL